MLEIESNSNTPNSGTVKQKIKRSIKRPTFFEVAYQHLKVLDKTNKFSQHATEESRIKRLKEFFGTDKIYFEDLTESTINKFKIFLKVDHEIGERTIANYLILLRTIFNKAIKCKIQSN